MPLSCLHLYPKTEVFDVWQQFSLGRFTEQNRNLRLKWNTGSFHCTTHQIPSPQGVAPTSNTWGMAMDRSVPTVLGSHWGSTSKPQDEGKKTVVLRCCNVFYCEVWGGGGDEVSKTRAQLTSNPNPPFLSISHISWINKWPRSSCGDASNAPCLTCSTASHPTKPYKPWSTTLEVPAELTDTKAEDISVCLKTTPLASALSHRPHAHLSSVLMTSLFAGDVCCDFEINNHGSSIDVEQYQTTMSRLIYI